MKRVLTLCVIVAMMVPLVTACNNRSGTVATTTASTTEITSTTFLGSTTVSETTQSAPQLGETLQSTTVTTRQSISTNASQVAHTHNFSSATCISPARCVVCGIVQGTALDHTYSMPTCTTPAKCSCGSTKGLALGHDYKAATCTAPKTCKTCGATDGAVIPHTYNEDGVCTVCGTVYSAIADYVTFHDATLEKQVKQVLGISEGEKVSKNAISVLSSFDIKDGITDVQDLKHATGLQSVSVNADQVKNLNTLCALPKATYVSFGSGKCVDVSFMKNMKHVETVYFNAAILTGGTAADLVASPKLHTFFFNNPDGGTNIGVDFLSSATSLEALELWHVFDSTNDISALRNLPKLKSFQVLASGTISAAQRAVYADLASKGVAVTFKQDLEPVDPNQEYVSDTPQNLGALNALLNMKQMAEIRYTPLKSLPQQWQDFKPGVERVGLVYSSTRPESLFVPNNVSFHTFMTALQNPNSYLYTVDLGKLGNVNGHTYYGAVCSTACAYALGIKPNYSTHQWPDIPGMETLADPSAEKLKLCDTIVGNGHVVMVTNITRNKQGEVGRITISEAVSPTVRSTSYTPKELKDRFPPTAYTYCRYENLASVTYQPSEYVAVEGEPQKTVTYNTAIIPRKGDKANWLAGQNVVLDVLQPASYTEVEIYKDGVLFQTKTIQSVITLSDLQAGKYQARLVKGNAHSDWCYWIVVDPKVTVTPHGSDRKVTVTFSATNATPLWVQWANGYQNGTVHVDPLSAEEQAAGTAVCSYKKGYFKIRVAFETEYGIVHSELPKAITVS
ncbi:MAG: hypothetical protein IJP14_04605 [Clostridia bacterium]|nr:hypothetical protein [Clostridia bacterium]